VIAVVNRLLKKSLDYTYDNDKKVMLNIEKDNLNDIGGQFKLNYNIFNQYVVVS
jgi:hypothetical protein